MKSKKWLELMQEESKPKDEVVKPEEKKEVQKSKDKPWINKNCKKPILFDNGRMV